MVGFVPKALGVIGSALLCLGMLLAADFVGSAANSPSATFLWSVIGSGVILSSGGLIAVTRQLDRDRRKRLARSFLVFGIASFALAMLIPHLGIVLLVLAVPAIVFSAIVSVMVDLLPKT